MEAQAPSRIDYRGRARRHYDAAQALLGTGNDDDLVYACLRLRMAIEALAYATVALFREDLPQEVLEDWSAERLLKEVAALDPGADGDIEVMIEDPQSGASMTIQDKRLTAKWARKNYRALGNFLHERSLLVLEGGKDTDFSSMRRRASEIAGEVQRVLEASGSDFRFIQSLIVECSCGGEIAVRIGLTQLRGRGRCAACSSNFDVHRVSGEPNRFRFRHKD